MPIYCILSKYFEDDNIQCVNYSYSPIISLWNCLTFFQFFLKEGKYFHVPCLRKLVLDENYMKVEDLEFNSLKIPSDPHISWKFSDLLTLVCRLRPKKTDYRLYQCRKMTKEDSNQNCSVMSWPQRNHEVPRNCCRAGVQCGYSRKSKAGVLTLGCWGRWWHWKSQGWSRVRICNQSSLRNVLWNL